MTAATLFSCVAGKAGVEIRRAPLREWGGIVYGLLASCVTWAAAALADAPKILITVYTKASWAERLMCPPTMFISIYVLKILVSEEQHVSLPQHSGAVMAAYLGLLHLAMPAVLRGLHCVRESTSLSIKEWIPEIVLDHALGILRPAMVCTLFWEYTRGFMPISEVCAAATLLAVSALCLWRLFVSGASVLQGAICLLPSVGVMAVRLAKIRGRSLKTAKSFYLAHAASHFGLILALQMAFFPEISKTQEGMVANPFIHAVLVLVLSPLTESSRWKVQVCQMAIFALAESRAVFVQWEEMESLAGFHPPAKPSMLILGLVVLPSVAASSVLVVVSTLVQMLRIKGFVHANRIVAK